MMPRYIDAENISNRINLTIKELSKDPIKYAFSVDNLETYLFMINEEKAEDVAPVIHANWIYDKLAGVAECSNCKYCIDTFYDSIAIGDYKYCPNCGAVMDEVI